MHWPPHTSTAMSMCPSATTTHPSTTTTTTIALNGLKTHHILSPRYVFFKSYFTITTNSFITVTFTIHLHHPPLPHHKNNNMFKHHKNSSSSRGLRCDMSQAPGTFFLSFLCSLLIITFFFLCRLIYTHHHIQQQ